MVKQALQTFYHFLSGLYAIEILIFTTIIYSLVAFINLDFDFRTWDIVYRMGIGALEFTLMILLVFLKVKKNATA